MKIMVTGSNGQVGTQLVRKLSVREDIDLLAMDVDVLDITDGGAIERVVNDFRPDAIINAAAYTAVDKAEHDREAAFLINSYGPRNLAVSAQKYGAALLHISTDYVFSGDKDGLYTEDDLVAPLGVYGESKLAGEDAIIAACERHIVLRTAWVFEECGNNFVKTMLRLGADKTELGIVGDQFGGPTYAGDIAAALIRVADFLQRGGGNCYGIYHFSGQPYVSWFDFANTIFDMACEQGYLSCKPRLKRLTTSEYPTLAKRPANSSLAMEKIFRTFNIVPSDWKSALNKIEVFGDRN